MDFISRKILGFHAPLGIRRRHMFMIGLMASMSMCIGLFVADGAQWGLADGDLVEEGKVKAVYLKEDCKLGILLTVFVAIPAYAFSVIFHLKDEDVIDEAHKQIDEELAEALKHHTHKMGGLFTGHIKLPSLPMFGSKPKGGQEESKEDPRDGATSIELKSDPEVTKSVTIVEASKEDGDRPVSPPPAEDQTPPIDVQSSQPSFAIALPQIDLNGSCISTMDPDTPQEKV